MAENYREQPQFQAGYGNGNYYATNNPYGMQYAAMSNTNQHFAGVQPQYGYNWSQVHSSPYIGSLRPTLILLLFPKPFRLKFLLHSHLLSINLLQRILLSLLLHIHLLSINLLQRIFLPLLLLHSHLLSINLLRRILLSLLLHVHLLSISPLPLLKILHAHLPTLKILP